jgi:hypothetical protein
MKDGRINISGDRDIRIRSRKVPVNTGAKPRGATRKAPAPASDLDSRLEKAARIAFRLGGED